MNIPRPSFLRQSLLPALVLALMALLARSTLANGLAPGETEGAPTPPIPWNELGAKATAQYSGDGLAVSATEGGARLRCAFQKLDGEVTREGLWLVSTAAESTGERFRVVATAVGRTAHAVPSVSGALSATGTVEVQGEVACFIRPGLVEEYRASVDGVRQDFVVRQSPAGGGRLRVELEVTGALVEARAQGARLVMAESGRQINYNCLQVTDANGKELTARMEVVSAGQLVVEVDDADAVYPVRIDPTFSDANWFGMGGCSGADYHVNAAAVDEAGNLYIGGGFSVVGDIAASRIAKWDGAHWSALGSGMNGYVNALAVTGSNLYAGGSFTTAGGVNANRIAVWDGTNWSALGSGVSGTVNALSASGNTLFAGGEFTTAGGGSAQKIAKWDGSNWTALGSGMNSKVLALALSGNELFAAGEFTIAGKITANYIAKWDGTDWLALGSGMDASVQALAASGSNLYAGGTFTNASGISASYIAKWDGNSWSALGSGMNSYGVYSLAVSGGTVYAGGWFGMAGGVSANHIAKWDGTNWSKVGTGLANRPNALVISKGDLYAGGYFTAWLDYPGNYIAKWDGTNWSVPGSARPGLSGSVSALAASGDNLYAAGFFSRVGELQVNNIAKWDGSSWSNLGSGMDSFVSALAVSGSDLYAGGYFRTAGGVNALRIAKWSGAGWAALGTGVEGGNASSSTAVLALAVSESSMYAGGNFTTAGGISANYIAKWNGITWTALGSGTDGPVFALAVLGSDLFVGGGFTTAGGITVNGIAKWNGSSWLPLGSGMAGSSSGPRVSALLVEDDNLYAGGYFATAGGIGVSHIAKWDGTAWSALGSGMNNPVSALSMSDRQLFAGGSFTTAGGIPASRIAAWDGAVWLGLGSGVGGPFPSVGAITVSGTSLSAGGEFSSAGGKVSANLARAFIPAHVGPPVILDQPQSRTVQTGDNLTLAVKAIGEPPLHYHWWKETAPLTNGGNISGADSASLNLTDVQTNNAGSYSVVVSNDLGTATSSNAVLTAIRALTLGEALEVPEWAWTSGGDAAWAGKTDMTHDGVDAARSGAITHGQQSWMETTIIGPGILRFWWKVSSEPNYDFLELYLNGKLQSGRISGEANWQLRTLSLSAGAQTLRWRYMKDGTDSAGQDCGWVDQVSFIPDTPPEIVGQPQGGTAAEGLNASFSVSATGTAPLGYRWWKDEAPLSNGGNISGADTATLNLTNIRINDAGGYSVVVTNTVGSVTSSVAVLTVKPRLVISARYPVADTAQPELALSSAFDGTNFLIGIGGDASSPNVVGAQLISPAGDPVGDLISTGRRTAGRIAAPYVAFGASNYLMVWTDAASHHPSSSNDVYAQFISPAGTLVGSAFPISSAAGDQDANGVAFDGTNFLVVWTQAGGLRGRLVSPTNQLLGSELVITSAQIRGFGQVSVAFGGGQYLVAWVEGPNGLDTKGRLISPAGGMGSILTVSQSTSDGYNPTSVACGADRFMVVWHHVAVGSADWNLRGRMVWPDGTMAGDELILEAGPNGERAMGSSVVFDGQYFLVVWADWVGGFPAGQATVLGRYWNSDGVPQGAAFTIEGTPATQLGVGLSAGSGKVLVVLNTGFSTDAADLCARFISRPFTQLTPAGTGSMQVSFNGVLQSSTNLQTWTDVTPQPTNPWTPPIVEGNLFFRTRTEP